MAVVTAIREREKDGKKDRKKKKKKKKKEQKENPGKRVGDRGRNGSRRHAQVVARASRCDVFELCRVLVVRRMSGKASKNVWMQSLDWTACEKVVVLFPGPFGDCSGWSGRSGRSGGRVVVDSRLSTLDSRLLLLKLRTSQPHVITRTL